jgi:hypothetical protein
MPLDDNSMACRGHWNRLEQTLGEIPELVDELNTTITLRSVGPRGPRSGEVPMPYGLAASDALELLHRTLWPWVREGMESHPNDTFRGTPGVVGLSRALLRYFGWLKGHPDGQLVIEEVAYAVKQATRSIDTPPKSTYIGPCDTPECEAELHVRAHATYAKCHLCGAVTNVEDKMYDAYRAASDRAWTVNEATTIIRNAGMVPASTAQVDRWARSGRLIPAGHSITGAPLYRLHDLIVNTRT